MKIGIITSWNEVLTLFNFLHRFNHNYVVYYDQNNRPYGDKDFVFSVKYIEKWIDYLKNQWVEKIIVPPTYELHFLENKKYNNVVLPIFTNYLMDCVFTNSLVGKIWLLWDFADKQVAQDLVYNLSKNYKLSENQTKIKKFNFPFKFWVKEVQMWKYFANNLSFSNFMVNKIIKFDLRYFKDSNVDTIVPLNYEYFNYQNTIFKDFNYKKQRFHKIDKLEKIFLDFALLKSKEYSVSVYYNWHVEFLKREKKNLWNLQRWKSVEIDFIKI